MDLGEEVYSIVVEWNYFDKDTIGKQLVRSVDSIAANLSEGVGRYHYKERKTSVITQEVHYLKPKLG
jgi:four helix bundle protein